MSVSTPPHNSIQPIFVGFFIGLGVGQCERTIGPFALIVIRRGGPHNDCQYRVQERVRSIPVQCDANPGQLRFQKN